MSAESTVMNRKSFAVYALWAGGITLIVATIVYLFFAAYAPEVRHYEERHRAWNAAQREYADKKQELEQWQQAEKQRAEKFRTEQVQRTMRLHCEQAMGGDKAALAAIKNQPCEPGVLALRTIAANSGTTSFERLEAMERLLRLSDRRPYLTQWWHAEGNTFVFTGEFEILNDTTRLARLLGGDSSAVSPQLFEQTTFEEAKTPEKFSALTPNIEPQPLPEPLHAFWWKLLYLVSSFVFGISFYVTGYIYSDSRRSNPFTTNPRFVLAYLIQFIFFPGFLLMKMMYWMSQNLNVGNKKLAGGFDARIAAAEQKLEKLNGGQSGNRAFLDLLRQTRDQKSSRTLVMLEDALAAIEHIKTNLAAERDLAE